MTHFFQNNTLYLAGNFTYKDYDIISNIELPENNLVVDFSSCEYLDSSALGILLIINEKCQVTLCNLSKNVENILNVYQLNTIFHVIK